MSSLLKQVVPHIESQTWGVISADIVQLDDEMRSSDVPIEVQEVAYGPLREIVSRAIASARQGNIRISSVSETGEMAGSLMRKARKRILVTSYIDPSEWWETTLGREYDELNEELVDRVGGYCRIYIIESEVELARLRPLMSRQAGAGLYVAYVMAEEIHEDLKVDFLVIDEYVASEMELDESRNFVSSTFYLSRVRAQDFSKRFAELRVYAIEISENWSDATRRNGC